MVMVMLVALVVFALVVLDPLRGVGIAHLWDADQHLGVVLIVAWLPVVVMLAFVVAERVLDGIGRRAHCILRGAHAAERNHTHEQRERQRERERQTRARRRMTP